MAHKYKIIVIATLRCIAEFDAPYEDDAHSYAKHLFNDKGIEVCVLDYDNDIRTDYCGPETAARISN